MRELQLTLTPKRSKTSRRRTKGRGHQVRHSEGKESLVIIHTIRSTEYFKKNKIEKNTHLTSKKPYTLSQKGVRDSKPTMRHDMDLRAKGWPWNNKKFHRLTRSTWFGKFSEMMNQDHSHLMESTPGWKATKFLPIFSVGRCLEFVSIFAQIWRPI